MMPYTEEAAVRAYELGDTLWPELDIDKPWGRRKDKSQESASDGPVANWTNYEEPDWYTVTQEDELPVEEPDPA
jgi:hypothetical protein